MNGATDTGEGRSCRAGATVAMALGGGANWHCGTASSREPENRSKQKAGNWTKRMKTESVDGNRSKLTRSNYQP